MQNQGTKNSLKEIVRGSTLPKGICTGRRRMLIAKAVGGEGHLKGPTYDTLNSMIHISYERFEQCVTCLTALLFSVKYSL